MAGPISHTKIKVSEVVLACLIEINGFPTTIKLNILPLGSYDILIRMDWLERSTTKVDFYAKTIKCHDDEGRPIKVKGVLHSVSLRKILALQLINFFRKGCQAHAIYMTHPTRDTGPKLEDHPLLQEHTNVFSEEVLDCGPRREIDFLIC